MKVLSCTWHILGVPTCQVIEWDKLMGWMDDQIVIRKRHLKDGKMKWVDGWVDRGGWIGE